MSPSGVETVPASSVAPGMLVVLPAVAIVTFIRSISCAGRLLGWPPSTVSAEPAPRMPLTLMVSAPSPAATTSASLAVTTSTRLLASTVTVVTSALAPTVTPRTTPIVLSPAVPCTVTVSVSPPPDTVKVLVAAAARLVTVSSGLTPLARAVTRVADSGVTSIAS